MMIEIDLAHPAVRANPYPLYARLRREAPVTQAKIRGLGSIWVLSRHEDVAQALKDQRLLSDRARSLGEKSARNKWWLPAMLRAFESSMVMQDDPNHRRLRSLVHQAFTPKSVEQLQGRATEVANELLDKAAKRGSVDLIEAYALPFPLTIISEMMGVPEKDRPVFRKLTDGFTDMTTELGDSMTAVAKGIPVAVMLARFFQKLVKLRRENPQDDLTSRLIQARAEGHAELSEEEVVAMLFLLLFAGHETTVNLIGSGMLALLQNPDQLALLREKPELIGSAVEEVLRYTSPAEHPSPRYTTEEMVYHGITIPRKAALLPLIGSANRDEDVFERPEQLDITRNPNRHVAFGLGVHFCLGAPLARLEGKIGLLTLVQRFPNLRLATWPENLKWRQSPGLRALQTLPLHLS